MNCAAAVEARPHLRTLATARREECGVEMPPPPAMAARRTVQHKKYSNIAKIHKHTRRVLNLTILCSGRLSNENVDICNTAHRHKVYVDEGEQARVQRGGIVRELSGAELDTTQ